jgi:hypothetical protein
MRGELYMKQFDQIATNEIIEKTAHALEANGIKTMVVESATEAKEMVLSMLPEHAEVMTMTSVTLDELGLSQEISESNKYTAVHPTLLGMNRETQDKEMKQMRSVNEYTVGSVHAVTEDGHVLIASRTGSQLSAYVFGATLNDFFGD